MERVRSRPLCYCQSRTVVGRPRRLRRVHEVYQGSLDVSEGQGCQRFRVARLRCRVLLVHNWRVASWQVTPAAASKGAGCSCKPKARSQQSQRAPHRASAGRAQQTGRDSQRPRAAPHQQAIKKSVCTVSYESFRTPSWQSPLRPTQHTARSPLSRLPSWPRRERACRQLARALPAALRSAVPQQPLVCHPGCTARPPTAPLTAPVTAQPLPPACPLRRWLLSTLCCASFARRACRRRRRRRCCSRRVASLRRAGGRAVVRAAA